MDGPECSRELGVLCLGYHQSLRRRWPFKPYSPSVTHPSTTSNALSETPSHLSTDEKRKSSRFLWKVALAVVTTRYRMSKPFLPPVIATPNPQWRRPLLKIFAAIRLARPAQVQLSSLTNNLKSETQIGNGHPSSPIDDYEIVSRTTSRTRSSSPVNLYETVRDGRTHSGGNAGRELRSSRIKTSGAYYGSNYDDLGEYETRELHHMQLDGPPSGGESAPRLESAYRLMLEKDN